MEKELYRIRVPVTEEEKAALKEDAAACGLSLSGYARRLLRGETPRPLPCPAFWELMEALYRAHRIAGELAAELPEAEALRAETEDLVLRLMEAV